jgi:23S rRNA maturation-related 3'-5' exoribonuclease YhaM
MPTQVVKEARTTVTTTDDIIDLDNNTKIEGKCLIKSYTVSEGRAGLYVTGILCLKGNIDFKVWNADAKNSLGNSMIVTDWQGKVVQFNGYVNVYNDRKSIILTDVTELPAENPMEYMPTPYDRPTEWQLYRDFAKENLSKKAYAVFQTILKGYDLYQLATECGYTLEKLPNNKLFSMEAAAIAHHDACPVGLIAHSRKVAENTVNLVKHYPTIIRTVDYDALVLGALLHDFGKAAEYYVGAIS